MKIDFIIPQRLLDHEQIERVDLAQMLKLIERVGGIRVHTENDIRPAGADLLEHIQIPSRLHLDLDPTVSRRQLSFDLLKKLFRRVLNPDRNAARDLAPRSSQQLPERQLFLPRLRVPHRIFERGFRHAVAADSGKPRRTIPASRQLTLQQQRRQILLDRRPRGFGPFRAVKRIFPGDALAPPAHSIDLDTHQQDAAAINAAKARFKKMHERHVNFTQRYRFDFHNELWFVSEHRFGPCGKSRFCTWFWVAQRFTPALTRLFSERALIAEGTTAARKTLFPQRVLAMPNILPPVETGLAPSRLRETRLAALLPPGCVPVSQQESPI